MKRFFCDKCGKCCEKLPALVIDPGLDDGTGKCKFYDSQTNLYSIKKAYGDASIFNTEADIKKAVNQKQNYKITDSSFNRSKGAKRCCK